MKNSQARTGHQRGMGGRESHWPKKMFFFFSRLRCASLATAHRSIGRRPGAFGVEAWPRHRTGRSTSSSARLGAARTAARGRTSRAQSRARTCRATGPMARPCLHTESAGPPPDGAVSGSKAGAAKAREKEEHLLRPMTLASTHTALVSSPSLTVLHLSTYLPAL